MTTTPWRGILTATALPFTADGAVDFDRYGEHVAWLCQNGSDGVVCNGSLGEYQTLTTEERAKVVETAVAAASANGGVVVPGVAAYGAQESRRWTEQAAEAGAVAVMLLPPNAYRADDRIVVEHYREVAKAGVRRVQGASAGVRRAGTSRAFAGTGARAEWSIDRRDWQPL